MDLKWNFDHIVYCNNVPRDFFPLPSWCTANYNHPQILVGFSRGFALSWSNPTSNNMLMSFKTLQQLHKFFFHTKLPQCPTTTPKKSFISRGLRLKNGKAIFRRTINYLKSNFFSCQTRRIPMLSKMFTKSGKHCKLFTFCLTSVFTTIFG